MTAVLLDIVKYKVAMLSRESEETEKESKANAGFFCPRVLCADKANPGWNDVTLPKDRKQKVHYDLFCQVGGTGRRFRLIFILFFLFCYVLFFLLFSYSCRFLLFFIIFFFNFFPFSDMSPGDIAVSGGKGHHGGNETRTRGRPDRPFPIPRRPEGREAVGDGRRHVSSPATLLPLR